MGIQVLEEKNFRTRRVKTLQRVGKKSGRNRRRRWEKKNCFHIDFSKINCRRRYYRVNVSSSICASLNAHTWPPLVLHYKYGITYIIYHADGMDCRYILYRVCPTRTSDKWFYSEQYFFFFFTSFDNNNNSARYILHYVLFFNREFNLKNILKP